MKGKVNGFGEKRIVIYTEKEEDADRLAYTTMAIIKDNALTAERHGYGYYPHFHDAMHSLHIWYGQPGEL